MEFDVSWLPNGSSVGFEGGPNVINLSPSRTFPPSCRLEKEYILDLKANLRANGKAHQYLISFCERTMSRGFRKHLFWMVEGEMATKI